MSAVSTGVARVRAVPVWFWLVATLALCVGAMVWHGYHQDDEDRDWLNPQQPATNLGPGAINLAVRVREEALAPVIKPPRIYAAGTLALCRDSWVGDC